MYTKIRHMEYKFEENNDDNYSENNYRVLQNVAIKFYLNHEATSNHSGLQSFEFP